MIANIDTPIHVTIVRIRGLNDALLSLQPIILIIKHYSQRLLSRYHISNVGRILRKLPITLEAFIYGYVW